MRDDVLPIYRLGLLYAGACILGMIVLCAGLLDALEYEAHRNRVMLRYLASIDNPSEKKA